MRFKFQAAIAYPESAQKIFAQKDEPEYVPDIEEFDPNNPGFSDEGISKMLEVMEQFGFYIEDAEK